MLLCLKILFLKSSQIVITVLAIFILGFLSGNLEGQILVKDTFDFDGLYQRIKYTESTDFPEWQQIDTLLSDFQYFDIVELPLGHSQYLGNAGQAHLDFFFQDRRKTGFQLGFRSFDHYLFRPDNIRYFNCLAPVTEMHYALGLNAEQRFNILHAQNITRSLNVSIDYRRNSSDGFFDRQRTSGHALAMNLWWQPANRRYSALGSFIWNKHDREQNGGLVDTEIFLLSALIRRDLAEVNIKEAKRTDINRSFRVLQYWDGGKYRNTALNDSTTLKELIPSWRLSLENSYSKENHRYFDLAVDPEKYLAVLIDSTTTSDTLDSWQFRNKASFIWMGQSLKDGNKLDSGHRIKASLEHEMVGINHIIEYDSSSLSEQRELNNLIVSLEAHNKLDARRNYQLSSSYILTGYQKGNIDVQALGAYNLNKLRFYSLIKYSQHRPYYSSERMIGNHQNWTNEFSDVKTMRGLVGVSDNDNKWSIELSQWSIANYSYFDSNALPQQLANNAAISQAVLKSHLNFGKWHFKNKIMLQTSNKSEIPLPRFSIYSSWYFHSASFGKSLEWQAGILFKYFSNFNAPQFDPSTAEFFLSDKGSRIYYPIIDPFMSLKIKRFRLFLRSENLNQGLGTARNGYFIAPYHPMADRAIKFGISWLFLD